MSFVVQRGISPIMPCMYSAVVEHGLPNGKRRKPPRIPPWGISLPHAMYSAAVEREPPNAESLPEPHGTSRSRTGIRQEGRRHRRSRARPACQGQRPLRRMDSRSRGQPRGPQQLWGGRELAAAC
jgi:hypothetical protein